MILTEDQIRAKIKVPNPIIVNELAQAQKDDDLCAMHSKTQTNAAKIKALDNYKSWVKGLLVDEKFQVFCHLLQTPLLTVEIVQGILSELKKVFEAEDRYIDYQFDSPEKRKAFEKLQKQIGEIGFWQGKGFEIMKSAPNSFMIIDLPQQQKGKTPQPYFYTISPCDVIETLPSLDSNLEFIIFRQDGFIYCFDDMSFFKFTDDGKGNYPLVMTAKHNLGYTPANTFWDTAMNVDSVIQKQNVILKSIGWLNSLLATITMGEHLGWYAGFPIIIGYEHKCNYQDDYGNMCNGNGIVIWTDTYGDTQQGQCPQCAKAKSFMYGPGSYHTAPAPATSDDPDLVSNGVKFIEPSTGGLEWIEKNKDSRIAWLTYNLIGIPDGVTAEAINEKQVVSQFETQVNVLKEVTRNFERIIKFTNDTLARLQAGPGFTGSTVKLGQEYFLYSASQLQDQYSKAKTAGAASYELSTQRHVIIQTKFRNNPRMRERQYILSWLEPYPDSIVLDLTTLGIPSNLIKLKAGLDYYVSRFEREYSDIVSFMELSPLSTKMDFIKGVLLSYIADESAQDAGTSGGGAPGGDNIETPVDVEAEAKAKLKGSVGGVQGILEIQAAVAKGDSDYDAAIAVLGEIFGFDEEKAKAILGPRSTKKPPTPQPQF